MTTFLVGTDSEQTSEKLLPYLEQRIDEEDTVYAVNSQVGGDDSNDEDILAGTDALKLLETAIGAETHQIVRGNAPQEDLLGFATDHDVDEIVIGIRKRSPTGKLLFGSTAQDLLLETDRPVVTVPLTD